MGAFKKLHFPERAPARNYFSLNGHLPEITIISQKTYFPEIALAPKFICKKLHSAKTTVHFPENLFSRIYIWKNVHFKIV